MNILSILLLSSVALQGAPGTGSEQPRSYNVARGGTLTVSIVQGDIRVIPWDKEEVAVRVKGVDEAYLDDLDITSDGKSVTIRNDPGWDADGDARFEISVPASFNLDLETSSGEIDVAGKLSGRIHARSSGGDMQTGDVDGIVEMSTSGGDIRTGDLTGTADLETAGGDISTGVIGGEADIKTSGGEIRIERAAKELTAHTAGGDVEVGDVGGKVSVVTAGGDIMLGHVAGSARLKTAGGNIDLSSAAGPVSAQTSGGDIRLDSVSGDVDARTTAGNVVVRMTPSGKESSRLSTSAGDVWLYLPENARASIDARLRIHGGRWRDADGSIQSDFEATKTERDRAEREIHATYTVNGGGPAVAIDVSIGNIEIRKADKFTRITRGRHKNRKE